MEPWLSAYGGVRVGNMFIYRQMDPCEESYANFIYRANTSLFIITPPVPVPVPVSFGCDQFHVADRSALDGLWDVRTLRAIAVVGVMFVLYAEPANTNPVINKRKVIETSKTKDTRTRKNKSRSVTPFIVRAGPNPMLDRPIGQGCPDLTHWYSLSLLRLPTQLMLSLGARLSRSSST